MANAGREKEPLLIRALALSGAGFGLVGGVFKIAGISEEAKSTGFLERLQKAIQEDEDASNELANFLLFRDPEESGLAWTITSMTVRLGPALGLSGSLQVVAQMVPFIVYLFESDKVRGPLKVLIDAFCERAKSTLTEITPEQEASTQAGKIALEAVKGMEGGITKNLAYQSAKEAAEEALNPTEDGAAVAINAGASDGISETNQVAVELSDDAAVAVAKAAAKDATKKPIATVAKVAGAVVVCLGAFFVIWDVFSIVQDSMKSSLGETLREIAQNHLENCPSQH